MQLIPDPRQPTDTLKCVHHYWDDGVICFYCENKWLKHQQIESVKTYFDFAKGWKFCEALLFLVHLRLHMQMTGFRLCNSFKLMKLCSISVSAASPPSFSRASFLEYFSQHDSDTELDKEKGALGFGRWKGRSDHSSLKWLEAKGWADNRLHVSLLPVLRAMLFSSSGWAHQEEFSWPAFPQMILRFESVHHLC